MTKFRALLAVLTGIVCGVVATIIVAALIHRWQLPIDRWLPRSMSLFLPPYVLATIVLAILLPPVWKKTTGGWKMLMLVSALISPFIGILISIPFVCAIARECL